MNPATFPLIFHQILCSIPFHQVDDCITVIITRLLKSKWVQRKCSKQDINLDWKVQTLESESFPPKQPYSESLLLTSLLLLLNLLPRNLLHTCPHRVLSHTWKRKWLMTSEVPNHQPSLSFPQMRLCSSASSRSLRPDRAVFPSHQCWSGLLHTANINRFVTWDSTPSSFSHFSLLLLSWVQTSSDQTSKTTEQYCSFNICFS